jgi:hypothetical protein
MRVAQILLDDLREGCSGSKELGVVWKAVHSVCCELQSLIVIMGDIRAKGSDPQSQRTNY